jgi:cytochrome b subunit of formate dehydrogenase
MSKSHAVLRFFRNVHLYAGIFTAPALLFFAFTGALQTFSLHETTQGSDYKPPAWIVALGQLHKKQTTIVPVRRPRPGTSEKPEKADRPDANGTHGSAASAGDPGRPSGPANGGRGDGPGSSSPNQQKANSHLPMKIFFLMVAIGLFLSTVTGVYMTYKYNRNRFVLTGLLIAGIVIPLLLLPF